MFIKNLKAGQAYRLEKCKTLCMIHDLKIKSGVRYVNYSEWVGDRLLGPEWHVEQDVIDAFQTLQAVEAEEGLWQLTVMKGKYE